MPGNLFESVFTMIFMALMFATLKFVEPSRTPPPPNGTAVDCQCEQTPLSPPPPPATITCPPSMPLPSPPLPPQSPMPEATPPPPLPPATPQLNFRPPHSEFLPPTTVYSSHPPPSLPSQSPCDIPSPPWCPWKDRPLPDLEFASAASLMKSDLLAASLISVIFLFTS